MAMGHNLCRSHFGAEHPCTYVDVHISVFFFFWVLTRSHIKLKSSEPRCERFDFFKPVGWFHMGPVVDGKPGALDFFFLAPRLRGGGVGWQTAGFGFHVSIYQGKPFWSSGFLSHSQIPRRRDVCGEDWGGVGRGRLAAT